MVHSLAFLNNLYGMDGLVVFVIGILIFGRRLPEMGRSLSRKLTTTSSEDWNRLLLWLMVILTIVMLVLLGQWWFSTRA